jgi:mono/diheme cytochrome c family protein
VKLFLSCVLFVAAIALSSTWRTEFAIAGARSAPQAAASHITLRMERSSALDLEVGGELAGVGKGGTRYVSREDLLALPQTTFTVLGDANFTGSAEIRGVTLAELAKDLGESPDGNLVVAICDDLYRANYSHAYIAAHQPLLVLEINGKPPDAWPKDSEGHGQSMGPYMISHANFTPSFKILSHSDTPQIPWGVVRLEFRNEKTVFAVIAPRGPNAYATAVQNGFKIAKQNCFRCHNMGDEGGQRAGHPWLVLSAWATADPDFFGKYINNPRSRDSHSDMPAFPEYDTETLRALTAYFSTFTSLPAAIPQSKAGEKKP